MEIRVHSMYIPISLHYGYSYYIVKGVRMNISIRENSNLTRKLLVFMAHANDSCSLNRNDDIAKGQKISKAFLLSLKSSKKETNFF